ncbi:MAG: flagellar hook-associated protein FlgK, partial [Alphaproteobacteria bacterium]|nr:flagellar hook-associated protein FlgK [Alphaproteobacteria bacterium]
MSLNSIMNAGQSGLTAAQMQLRVVSDNVANVNTPGYVRKVAEQISLMSEGVGVGVEVTRVRLATDRFLQAATMSASAEAQRHGVRYELFDRIQGMFGDPGGTSGFFAKVDEMFAAFAATAEDPASSPARQAAIFGAQNLFDEGSRISRQIQTVREDADGRIKSAVDRANGLLQQIEALNVQIAKATVVNDDASGAEAAQARLIDELSGILDVRVSQRNVGGVSIRTNGGALLAGDGFATLDYARAGVVNAESSFNEIWVTEPRGQKRPLLDGITSGEIKGLVELRDQDAPQAAERLAELLTRAADELNRAHNANTAVPAPQTLSGRNVGQSLDTALAGFTGRTAVLVTDAAGVVQTRVDLSFDGAGNVDVGGDVVPVADFLAELNAKLGTSGTASFVDGRLTLSAAAGRGVAVVDDPDLPARKQGMGLSHFFGLNDLIRTDRPAIYATGLGPASPHGFPAGQTLKLRLTGDTGARLRDVEVTVPAGSMTDLLAALNDPVTGAGGHGTFRLNGDGSLSFVGHTTPAARLSVLEDRTSQTASGVSMTELFGIGGGVRASRADGFSLRGDIARNPALLGLARADAAAAVGARALV